MVVLSCSEQKEKWWEVIWLFRLLYRSSSILQSASDWYLSPTNLWYSTNNEALNEARKMAHVHADLATHLSLQRYDKNQNPPSGKSNFLGALVSSCLFFKSWSIICASKVFVPEFFISFNVSQSAWHSASLFFSLLLVSRNSWFEGAPPGGPPNMGARFSATANLAARSWLTTLSEPISC